MRIAFISAGVADNRTIITSWFGNLNVDKQNVSARSPPGGHKNDANAPGIWDLLGAIKNTEI
jgi:hypothetical protein